MNNLKNSIANCKKENKIAIIPQIMAAYPTIAKSEQLMLTILEAGADALLINIPFSDPASDSPIMQRAAKTVIDQKIPVTEIFQLIEKISAKTDKPILTIVYYNMVLAYGTEKFIQLCLKSGISGIILPELPLEERNEFLNLQTNLEFIPLIAPNSETRIPEITKGNFGGFFCFPATNEKGVPDALSLSNFAEKIRKSTQEPLILALDYCNKEQLTDIKNSFDAIVVGSQLLELFEQNSGNVSKINEFIKELKANS